MLFKSIFTACDGMIDLALVIDKSGSIEHQRFPMVKDFLAQILSQLSMWEDKVRVATVSFHDDAELHYNLNTYRSRQQVSNRASSNNLLTLYFST